MLSETVLEPPPADSFVVGIAALLSAASLSAAASVYFEMMLKREPASANAAAASLWLRNIQLGLFSTPLAAASMLANDGAAVGRDGVLHGFDGLVWAIVLCNGGGGLLVAACMKYADNIVKCFATAAAIVTGTLISVPLFGFAPSKTFALGATAVVCATTLYAWAPELALPWLQSKLEVAKISRARSRLKTESDESMGSVASSTEHDRLTRNA